MGAAKADAKHVGAASAPHRALAAERRWAKSTCDMSSTLGDAATMRLDPAPVAGQIFCQRRSQAHLRAPQFGRPISAWRRLCSELAIERIDLLHPLRQLVRNRVSTAALAHGSSDAIRSLHTCRCSVITVARSAGTPSGRPVGSIGSTKSASTVLLFARRRAALAPR